MSVGLSEIAHLILIFIKNPTELCRLLKIQRLTSSAAVSRESLHTAPSMEALLTEDWHEVNHGILEV